MNFGIMMIWNWIIGLVLFFPVAGLTYFICEKKYGKDVMKIMDDESGDFDMECLFATAIAALLWEAAYPVMVYMLVINTKRMYESMHQ